MQVVDLKDAGMTRQLSTRLSQRSRLLRNQTNRWRSATRKVRVRTQISSEIHMLISVNTLDVYIHSYIRYGA